MNTKELLKKYKVDIDHSLNVSRLSYLLFQKLIPFFPNLKNYDNKNDLNILKTASMLHDIGINLENIYKLKHHKAGCEFILKNKPDEIKEEDLNVLGCLIRYHRKSFPKPAHFPYKILSDKEKSKVKYLGAILRLADAFDELHLGIIDDFKMEFNPKLNVLTLILTDNIMLNNSIVEALNRKKDFFEYAFSARIEVAG